LEFSDPENGRASGEDKVPEDKAARGIPQTYRMLKSVADYLGFNAVLLIEVRVLGIWQ
jgi:hypothetical protein